MESKIISILIPTDFSQLSENALKVGISVAKRQNAEITILHVIDKFSYLLPTEVFLPEVRITPDIKLMMEEKLRELCDTISNETGIKVKGMVLSGNPSDVICEVAFREKTSMIVMGSHGLSGLREFFIGSEAFRVVKNATCPVLTIPGDWKKTNFSKVLFPIRLNTDALDKYIYAKPIIEKNKSELLVLGLSEKNKPNDLKDLTLLVDKFKLQLHNDQILFSSFISPCDSFSIKVFSIAQTHDIDLIILTANLDYNLKAYFVGPFVQQIINHSNRPVLSIKPPSELKEKTNSLEQAQNWGKEINYAILGE